MYIGVDIGTTNISFALTEADGKLIREYSLRNVAGMDSDGIHDCQSPQRIAQLVEQGLTTLGIKNGDIGCVGICCQMHGIVYTYHGEAVSPLYTWRDSCGNEVYRGGMTYAEYVNFRTGYKVATGYGICTHFYLSDKGRLPEFYDRIYTIGDYIVMYLTGRSEMPIHVTSAASLGVYDIAREDFDREAIASLDLDPEVFPPVTPEVKLMGRYGKDVYVSGSVADCQAAFYGSGAASDEMVLNVGTGGQLSCLMRNVVEMDENSEIRPYFDSQYIYVASSLCGGAAYETLNSFFKKTLAAFGVEKSTEEIYNVMELFEKKGEPRPEVITTFKGTRKEPGRKGVITELSPESFTPERLTYAFLEGIEKELHPYYEQFLKVGEFKGIVLTGNLFRKCPSFKEMVREKFQLPIRVAQGQAEAATGAAYTARNAHTRRVDIKTADGFIKI